MSRANEWLIVTWTDCLAETLRRMTNVAVTAQPLLDAAAPLAELPQLFWWEQPLEGIVGGRLQTGADTAGWRKIGEATLAAAAITDAAEENIQNSYIEILVQTGAALGERIAALVKREVRCTGGMQAFDLPKPPVLVSVVLENSTTLTLAVHFTDALVSEVESALLLPGSANIDQPAGSPSGSYAGVNLDLLLDVELPVSVSFGRAELMLKEVLKLSSGSIIELNRSVSEPVELIVNNCVIARGEVMMVEGNYGVRIQQIMTPQERLKTLR